MVLLRDKSIRCYNAYCIAGLYKRVAPVLGLFLVPLISLQQINKSTTPKRGQNSNKNSGWNDLDWAMEHRAAPEVLMSIPSFSHRAVDINELMSNTKFAGYMFA